MSKILNFGSLNIDYVYQVDHFVSAGETLSSDSMAVNCGGKGLNQSIAAAKAGGEVYHAGKIGADGQMLTDELEKNGVNTDCLTVCDAKCGHAIIQVDKSGQNCILLYSGSNSMNTEQEIDRCLENFGSGDWLLLQNEINLIPYIIDKAYEKGMKIVLNPSPITADIADYPIHKVSLLILNEIEGAALGGDGSEDEILNELRRKYKDTAVLLTLGKKGAVYFDGKSKTQHGIYDTKVVDTTAAGDTMMGYFVAMLAKGKEPDEALKIASMASSITVSRKGAAASIPTISEIKI